MVDILQILQQFLCYGSSNCINLFNQYTYKPMEGLFYAVFFPILFIILFVYIVASSVSPNKGFRALMSVAVFAFIIMQGWYYFFASMAEFWLYGLIFLGFLWVLMYTLVGPKKAAGGGGGRAAMMTGGPFGKALNLARRKVTKAEKDEAKALEAQLRVFEAMTPGQHGLADAAKNFGDGLRAFRENSSYYGINTTGQYNKLLDRFKKNCKKKGIEPPYQFDGH